MRKKDIIIVVIVICVLGSILLYFFKQNANVPLVKLTPPIISGSLPGRTADIDTSKANNNQFVQEFIKAVDAGKVSSDFYAALPAYENTKPSQLELQQYIQIFTDNFARRIRSFTPMTRLERSVYQSQIARSKKYARLARTAKYYWLELDESARNSFKRFPMIIPTNSNGQATFSQEWIADSYRIYSYAKLYFSAIKDKSTASLESILSDPGDDKDLISSKVKQVLAFYGAQQTGSVHLNDNYTLSALRGDLVEVEQTVPASLLYSEELTEGASSRKTVNRYVQAHLTKEGKYKIFDIIPTKETALTFTILRQNVPVAALDQPIDNFTILRIFGPWSEAFFYPVKINGNEGEIYLKFKDLQIKIAGKYDRASHNFSGHISGISVKAAAFTTAQNIGIGADRADIVKRFPFIVRNDYKLSFPEGNITFLFDSYDKVKEIILAKG